MRFPDSTMYPFANKTVENIIGMGNGTSRIAFFVNSCKIYVSVHRALVQKREEKEFYNRFF